MPKMIPFQSANVPFAIESSFVSDIHPADAISVDPKPPGGKAAIDYMGRKLKLIDFAGRTKRRLAPSSPPQAKILLVKTVNGTPAMALWADSVDGEVDADIEQIHAMPQVFGAAIQSYFPSVLRMQRRLALMFNAQAIAKDASGHPISSRPNETSETVRAADPDRPNAMSAESQTEANAKQTSSAQDGKGAHQVLIFPARLPARHNRPVSYLFSLRQIVDVLRHPTTQWIPFGPSYAKGIAEWRGRVLPVLSLEQSLGMEPTDQAMPLRTIVVQGAHQEKGSRLKAMYAIFNVGAAVRQHQLPLACTPVEIPRWISKRSFVSGAYETENQLLLAINLERILGLPSTRDSDNGV
ncbi:MAG: chemotaxis protein CheW [Desulfobacteraceae bacterium]|jgi:chemotaxis signal transduction protein